MIVRTSFDTPTLPRLSTIIAELQSGVIAIPEFQRPSVWRDKQRLDLLDSIVKGLPIGSLLVWRSGNDVLNTYTEIAGIPVPPPRAGVDRRTYLIDGHQRVTTLFGALVRPDKPRQGEAARRWPLYYELGTTEALAFRLPPRGGPVPEHWLPLDILFDSRELYRFRDRLFKKGEDDRAEEAERIANVFKDYIIPVVPLVNDDLDLVTDAFVRINSQGSPMTEAHMLRALTYQKGARDTHEGFAEIRAALEPRGWGEVPEQTLVNCLKAAFGLDVYRSNVRELQTSLKSDPTALGRLKVAILEAVDLLEGAGVGGWGALPYAYQLVSLTALAYSAPGTVVGRSELLRRWFWRTTYAEYFTGATGGQIRRGIEMLAQPDPALDAISSNVVAEAPPGPLRKGTVRGKAFMLFLTGLSSRPGQRRPVFAAVMSRGSALPVLFPKWGAIYGNLVVADAKELVALRKALGRGELAEELQGEFAIPKEAVECLPDQEAFINARSRAIQAAESDLLNELGMVGGDTLLKAVLNALLAEPEGQPEWFWPDEAANEPVE